MSKRQQPQPMKCPIVERATAPVFMPGARRWSMGEISIILTENDGNGLHLSLAHPRRLPTWDEVKRVRYELLPANRTFAMLLPPREQYVNAHEFCFHLVEVRGNADQGVSCL